MPLQPLDLPDVWIPTGYGTTYQHIREARAKYAGPMHPAYDRRLWPAIASTVEGDGKTRVGVGSAWRPTPSAVSEASRNGWSFHQDQVFKSGLVAICAIDAVAKDGPDANFNHDGVSYQDAKKIERFGLHANVGTPGHAGYESWHWQPFEIDSYASWVKMGRPDPSMTFRVPGIDGSVPIVVPMPPGTAVDYGLYPLNDSKPRLTLGAENTFVRYAQSVMVNKANQLTVIGNVDGQFGPRTQAAVNNIRAVFGLPLRGLLDWDGSWEAIDLLAGYDWSKPDPSVPQPPVESDLDGLYYVQPGDSPWKASVRCFGDGSVWEDHFKVGQFNKANYYARVAKFPGRITKVLPGEGPLAIIKRLYPKENQYKLLQRFYDLNGSEGRTLYSGEAVFLNQEQ